MKKLIAVIMFLGFLVLPLSAQANCSHYRSDLVGQCFVTTIDDVEYTACFEESNLGIYPSGPCPCGVVTLSYWENVGMGINDLISIDFNYSTNPDYVIIEGLDFILIDGRLILMPEKPLIFNQIED